MPPYNIVVFGGDHCGPEVTVEAVKVLKAIERCRSEIQFEFVNHLLGGASIDAKGVAVTDEVITAATNADAVLLGAIGGPEWEKSEHLGLGLLELRKAMEVYANVRPCSFVAKELIEYSSLKAEVCRDVDFTVVRELTGGIYFGARKEESGDGVAWDTEIYSIEEIKRVTRFAANLCLQSDPPLPLCSLDKANVLATSRLWRKIVTEVMDNEFPTIKYTHRLIDSAAMLMVKQPTALNGVIVTSNLFGDIITDEASVICGGLGMMPSASLSGVPKLNRMKGLYEPIHGSAPDISGTGAVNPLASILSAAMMLRHSLDLPSEATAVEDAVRLTIEQGICTRDIGGSAKTWEVGNAVVANLENLMQR